MLLSPILYLWHLVVKNRPRFFGEFLAIVYQVRVGDRLEQRHHWFGASRGAEDTDLIEYEPESLPGGYYLPKPFLLVCGNDLFLLRGSSKYQIRELGEEGFEVVG